MRSIILQRAQEAGIPARVIFGASGLIVIAGLVLGAKCPSEPLFVVLRGWLA